MPYRKKSTLVLCTGIAGLLLATGARLRADDASDVKRQIELLQQQNAALLEQVRQQQAVIEKLNQRVSGIEQASAQQIRELEVLKTEAKDATPKSSGGFNLGKVNISGHGAVAFFESQSNGQFPNSEFRVDEAKLFVEAPVWEDVYFFTELNLATRENDTLELNLGELYVDFEDVSKLWGCERMLNVRAGRLDIPFGEEYLTRDGIDNPLISHSIADLWGVDEGIELYGSIGKFNYVVAVQNGGVPGTRDFDADKSVAGRVSFDPNRRLHLSVSAMRTGDLAAAEDEDNVSELWFGGGWFRSIGSADTTTFHANLLQGDVALRFSRGHLSAFGGWARYDDNDPNGNNQRDLYYYSVEGVYDVTRKFYVAARFGQIFVEDGYPLPGQGDMGEYFYSPFAPLAEELWRATLGLGYRFSEHLVVKAEYSFEQGKEVGGNQRNHVNLFSAQAAFGF